MAKSRKKIAKRPVPKKTAKRPAPKKTAKKPAPKKTAKKPVPKKTARKPVHKKSRREQIKAVRDMLLDMKEQLLKEISENVKIESDTLKAEIGDIYDLASRDRERELSLLLGNRDREKLMQIEEALGRIEEGTYGFCEECGERISAGRLMVMPFTTVCVECKSKIEKEEGSFKTVEEEGSYQGLVSFDLDEDES